MMSDVLYLDDSHDKRDGTLASLHSKHNMSRFKASQSIFRAKGIGAISEKKNPVHPVHVLPRCPLAFAQAAAGGRQEARTVQGHRAIPCQGPANPTKQSFPEDLIGCSKPRPAFEGMAYVMISRVEGIEIANACRSSGNFDVARPSHKLETHRPSQSPHRTA